MKVIKLVGKIVLWVGVLVVALVLALPLWIGPVVKTAGNLVVPKITGTAFNLGVFGLNPYTGRLTVGDMQLYNPPDFKQKMAATLGSLTAEADMATLAGDVVVIRDIAIKDVFVSYVSNDKGENNFAIIKRNAKKGEEVKGLKGEGVKDAGTGPQKGEGGKDAGTKKRVIIDHLKIEGVMVQFGMITLPLPAIELSGIGRKSNGATLEETWGQIWGKITEGINALGVNINDLISGIGNIKLDEVKKALDGGMKGVTEAAQSGAGVLTKATGKTLGTVGQGVNKTTEAVGQGVNKTTEAVGKGVEKTTEAVKGVGETATKGVEKAAEALKSLF